MKQNKTKAQHFYPVVSCEAIGNCTPLGTGALGAVNCLRDLEYFFLEWHCPEFRMWS